MIKRYRSLFEGKHFWFETNIRLRSGRNKRFGCAYDARLFHTVDRDVQQHHYFSENHNSAILHSFRFGDRNAQIRRLLGPDFHR